MKKFKRLIAMLLCLVMLMQPIAFAASVADFLDFPQGWSKDSMTSAEENGLIIGKSENIVAPNDNLTRAELAAMITRAFGATRTADISRLTDVSTNDWFYTSVARAYQMGALTGTSDTTFEPEANITREQVFLVIARVICLSNEDTSSLNKFSDADKISDWAKNALSALVANGYVNGYPDGSFRPQDPITREELAQVFHNIFKTYISIGGYHTSVNVPGSVIVRASGAHLENVTIDGDLIIADGVGAGEFDLGNVTVNGRIIARGGEGKVTFKNVTVRDGVIIYDPNGVVNFNNYRDEAPFKNLTELTPARFLERKPTPPVSGGGGGGGSSTISTKYTINYYTIDENGNYKSEPTYTKKVKRNQYAPNLALKDEDKVPGYTFKYWSEEKNGTEAFDFEDTKIRQSYDLYAVYEKGETPPVKTWDVTFWVNTDAKVEDVVDGEAVSAPTETPVLDTENPDRYVFQHWAVKDGDLAVAYDFDTAVKANLDLIAVFKYDASKVPSYTTPDGQHFVYWQYEGAEYDFDTLITAPVELTPYFEDNDVEPEIFTVKFYDTVKYGADADPVKVVEVKENETIAQGTVTDEKPNYKLITEDGFVRNADVAKIYGDLGINDKHTVSYDWWVKDQDGNWVLFDETAEITQDTYVFAGSWILGIYGAAPKISTTFKLEAEMPYNVSVRAIDTIKDIMFTQEQKILTGIDLVDDKLYEKLIERGILTTDLEIKNFHKYIKVSTLLGPENTKKLINEIASEYIKNDDNTKDMIKDALSKLDSDDPNDVNLMKTTLEEILKSENGEDFVDSFKPSIVDMLVGDPNDPNSWMTLAEFIKAYVNAKLDPTQSPEDLAAGKEEIKELLETVLANFDHLTLEDLIYNYIIQEKDNPDIRHTIVNVLLNEIAKGNYREELEYYVENLTNAELRGTIEEVAKEDFDVVKPTIIDYLAAPENKETFKSIVIELFNTEEAFNSAIHHMFSDLTDGQIYEMLVAQFENDPNFVDTVRDMIIDRLDDETIKTELLKKFNTDTAFNEMIREKILDSLTKENVISIFESNEDVQAAVKQMIIDQEFTLEKIPTVILDRYDAQTPEGAEFRAQIKDKILDRLTIEDLVSIYNSNDTVKNEIKQMLTEKVLTDNYIKEELQSRFDNNTDGFKDTIREEVVNGIMEELDFEAELEKSEFYEPLAEAAIQNNPALEGQPESVIKGILIDLYNDKGADGIAFRDELRDHFNSRVKDDDLQSALNTKLDDTMFLDTVRQKVVETFDFEAELKKQDINDLRDQLESVLDEDIIRDQLETKLNSNDPADVQLKEQIRGEIINEFNQLSKDKILTELEKQFEADLNYLNTLRPKINDVLEDDDIVTEIERIFASTDDADLSIKATIRQEAIESLDSDFIQSEILDKERWENDSLLRQQVREILTTVDDNAILEEMTYFIDNAGESELKDFINLAVDSFTDDADLLASAVEMCMDRILPGDDPEHPNRESINTLLVDTIYANLDILGDQDSAIGEVVYEAAGKMLDTIDQPDSHYSIVVKDYVILVVESGDYSVFTETFVEAEQDTRDHLIDTMVQSLDPEDISAFVDTFVDEQFQPVINGEDGAEIDTALIVYLIEYMENPNNEEKVDEMLDSMLDNLDLELLQKLAESLNANNGAGSASLSADTMGSMQDKLNAVNKLTDELCYEDEMTVDTNNVFIFEPLLDILKKYNFDFVASKIPAKVQPLLPMDYFEEMFNRFYTPYVTDLEAKVALALADTTGTYSTTVGTGIQVDLNPVSDFFIPALEHVLYLEPKAISAFADADKLELYYTYYQMNPYREAYDEFLSTTAWFNGTDKGHLTELSGFSLKDPADYYDIIQAVTLIVDDAIAWYYDDANVPAADRNAVIDTAETKVLLVANTVNEFIVDFALNGIPTTLTEFVKRVERNNPTMLAYIDRFGVDAYIDRLENNATADKVYDTAFDKIMGRFGARIEALLDRYVTTRFNRVYDEAEFEKGKEIIHKLFTPIVEDLYDMDEIYDTFFTKIISKEFEYNGITVQILNSLPDEDDTDYTGVRVSRYFPVTDEEYDSIVNPTAQP